jgi:predicted Zn-dependent peptidase
MLSTRALPVAYDRYRCPNGLRVVACQLRETRAASARVYLTGGSRAEPDDLAGVAHFLEHAVFKGTARWPDSRALGFATERVGGAADAFTDKDHSGFVVHGPADYLELFLEVLADLLVAPLLDPKEVERERDVIAEELRSYRDDSDDMAKTELERALWPRHPLGREIVGTTATIRRMTREDLDRFRRDWFVPGGAVVSVASPHPTADVFRMVEQAFGGWEGGPLPELRPAPPAPAGPVLHVQNRRAEQVRFRLGFPVPSRREPHRHTLELISTALAGPATSRLELRLREELALVYDVSAALELYDDTGVLSIAAGVSGDKMMQAVRAVIAELQDLKAGPSDDEVERIKEYLAGRWLVAEGTDFHAGFAGRDEQVFGEPTTVDEEIERLRAIRPEQLRELANQVFVPKNLFLTSVGPFRHVPALGRAVAEL